VVYFHGRLVDVGFEDVVGESEFGKSMGHFLIGFDFNDLHFHIREVLA
jgi:hypothetical protein